MNVEQNDLDADNSSQNKPVLCKPEINDSDELDADNSSQKEHVISKQMSDDSDDEDSPSESLSKLQDKENLPSWTKFRLKRFDSTASYREGVIIDHYLIVITSEVDSCDKSEINRVLAFNLLDHSVQKAKIKIGSLQRLKYSLIRYDGNKIIKYGGDSKWSLTCLTIESFEPLTVKCEEIEDQNRGKFAEHTAQIYKDFLYVYGQVTRKKKDDPFRDELWSFDLKNRTWKFHETTGEALELDNVSHSFIFQNNLVIHGRHRNEKDMRDFFMLNLDSMTWTRIKQQKNYLQCFSGPCMKLGGTIYKDHLVILKDNLLSDKNAICFLNLHTKNTWSSFNIKDMKANPEMAWSWYDTLKDYLFNPSLIFRLMIFKNLVLSLALLKRDLVVFVMSLDSFGISAPKSAEEEYLSSLFLSEKESDVSFKIGNELIPAHKYVLVKKSRYFANLFNSGMIESRQDIIEIQDCEYEIFKDYLQYIYQETINLDDIDGTIKIYALADKYLQEDLREKCLYFMGHNINQDNVYKIFDFAHEENISHIKNWCMKFLRDNLNPGNLAELIEYLDRKEDPEFKESILEFRNFVFSFVLNGFFDLYENEKGSMQLYENFIRTNIEMGTISVLVRFLSCSYQLPEIELDSNEGPADQKRYSRKDDSEIKTILFSEREVRRLLKKKTTPRTKTLFEEKTIKLREAAFSFVHENFETVMSSKASEDLSNGFLGDFNLYSAERTSKQLQELIKKLNHVKMSKDNQENSKENEKKRMEPIQEGVDEENPTLKKTKK